MGVSNVKFFLFFQYKGSGSGVPFMADRIQHPEFILARNQVGCGLAGVLDLTAMATLQEFLHGISMGLVLFCLFVVFNLSLLYQYL